MQCPCWFVTTALALLVPVHGLWHALWSQQRRLTCKALWRLRGGEGGGGGAAGHLPHPVVQACAVAQQVCTQVKTRSGLGFRLQASCTYCGGLPLALTAK